MSLFQRQLTTPERNDLLSYYQEACLITAFQDAESERYNRGVEAFQSGRNTETPAALLGNAARMFLANCETLKRFEELVEALPDLAKAHFGEWYGLFVGTRAWSAQTYDTLKKISQGQEPDRAKAQMLSKVMEGVREKAEEEARKLTQRIRITASERQTILSLSMEELRLETWTPETYVVQETFETLTSATDCLAMYEMIWQSWIRQESQLTEIGWIVQNMVLPDWREHSARLGDIAEVEDYPCLTEVTAKLPMLYMRCIAFDVEAMRIAGDASSNGLSKAKLLHEKADGLRLDFLREKDWAISAVGAVGADAEAVLAEAAQKSWHRWEPRLHDFFTPEQIALLTNL